MTLTPTGTTATEFTTADEVKTAFSDDAAKDTTGLKMYRES